jgi:ferredoxin-NADP reductase
MELLYWLQDIREYLRVSRRRNELRKPGAGVDYAGAEYRGVVSRAVSRLHPDRMRLHVVDIVQETPSTRTYRCERSDGVLPPFRAGQYVNVFVDADGVLTSRPYSISSPPPDVDAPGLIDLTVRMKPGGFVSSYILHHLEIGDEIETTGPTGSFYHEPLIDTDDLVFLAGGSGITPFRSVIHDVLRRRLPLRMHLLYGSRSQDDVIFGEELAALAEAHPNFDFALVVSEPSPDYAGLTGFLDADLIGKEVGDVAGRTFFICGPAAMYDFCLAELEGLGVEPYRVRRERYGPPDDVTQEFGWPAQIAADTLFEVNVVGGRAVRVPAGEPLMNSLERHGVVVPAICRTGACSACRTRLLEGRVFMPAHVGLRESDRENGYIHPCVAFPVTDIRIEL